MITISTVMFSPSGIRLPGPQGGAVEGSWCGHGTWRPCPARALTSCVCVTYASPCPPSFRTEAAVLLELMHTKCLPSITVSTQEMVVVAVTDKRCENRTAWPHLNVKTFLVLLSPWCLTSRLIFLLSFPQR